MPTRCVEENYIANGEPAVGEDLAGEAPTKASCSPKGDSRGCLEKQSDQGMNQETRFGNKLQVEEENQCAASEEGNGSHLGLSFPRKLWAIVENEAFGSAVWNEDGDTVMIDADLFQTEILNRHGTEKIFETDSLKSFICQLNLHGFKKICPEESVVQSGEKKKMMVYRNSNFQRNKPKLLKNFSSTDVQPTLDLQVPRSKRRKCGPPGHSLRLSKIEVENTMSQTEVPNDQEPGGNEVCMPTSVPGSLPITCLPQELSDSCGDGTSVNTTLVPSGSAKVEDAGAVSRSSLRYPNFASVMSFYNICSSIVKAALSALNELSDEEEDSSNNSSDEEEQEGCPQHQCVICKIFRGSSSS